MDLDFIGNISVDPSKIPDDSVLASFSLLSSNSSLQQGNHQYAPQTHYTPPRPPSQNQSLQHIGMMEANTSSQQARFFPDQNYHINHLNPTRQSPSGSSMTSLPSPSYPAVNQLQQPNLHLYSSRGESIHALNPPSQSPTAKNVNHNLFPGNSFPSLPAAHNPQHIQIQSPNGGFMRPPSRSHSFDSSLDVLTQGMVSCDNTQAQSPSHRAMQANQQFFNPSHTMGSLANNPVSSLQQCVSRSQRSLSNQFNESISQSLWTPPMSYDQHFNNQHSMLGTDVAYVSSGFSHVGNAHPSMQAINLTGEATSMMAPAPAAIGTGFKPSHSSQAHCYADVSSSSMSALPSYEEYCKSYQSQAPTPAHSRAVHMSPQANVPPERSPKAPNAHSQNLPPLLQSSQSSYLHSMMTNFPYGNTKSLPQSTNSYQGRFPAPTSANNSPITNSSLANVSTVRAPGQRPARPQASNLRPNTPQSSVAASNSTSSRGQARQPGHVGQRSYPPQGKCAGISMPSSSAGRNGPPASQMGAPSSSPSWPQHIMQNRPAPTHSQAGRSGPSPQGGHMNRSRGTSSIRGAPPSRGKGAPLSRGAPPSRGKGAFPTRGAPPSRGKDALPTRSAPQGRGVVPARGVPTGRNDPHGRGVPPSRDAPARGGRGVRGGRGGTSNRGVPAGRGSSTMSRGSRSRGAGWSASEAFSVGINRQTAEPTACNIIQWYKLPDSNTPSFQSDIEAMRASVAPEQPVSTSANVQSRSQISEGPRNLQDKIVQNNAIKAKEIPPVQGKSNSPAKFVRKIKQEVEKEIQVAKERNNQVTSNRETAETNVMSRNNSGLTQSHSQIHGNNMIQDLTQRNGNMTPTVVPQMRPKSPMTNVYADSKSSLQVNTRSSQEQRQAPQNTASVHKANLNSDPSTTSHPDFLEETVADLRESENNADKLQDKKPVISARDKVRFMWQAGQVVGRTPARKKNRVKDSVAADSPSDKEDGQSEVIDITDGVSFKEPSEARKKITDKSELSGNGKNKNANDQTTSERTDLFYVLFHGHKLLCFASGHGHAVLVCQFQYECFPDKGKGSVSNCINRALRIKKKVLDHPSKEQVIKFLEKNGFLKSMSLEEIALVINLDDARRVYHYIYKISKCSLSTCVIKILNQPVDLDAVVSPSKRKILTHEMRMRIKREKKSHDDENYGRLQQQSSVSPKEKIKGGEGNREDHTEERERQSFGSISSDQTVAYGKDDSDDVFIVEGPEDPYLLKCDSKHPKTGGVCNTIVGQVRFYQHEKENYLVVSDLCRILGTSEFMTGIEADNVVLYSCSKDILSFVNGINDSFPCLDTGMSCLVKEKDIGVYSSDSDNVGSERGTDPGSLKRPQCKQEVIESDEEDESVSSAKRPCLSEEVEQNSLLLEILNSTNSPTDGSQKGMEKIVGKGNSPSKSIGEDNLENTVEQSQDTSQPQLVIEVGKSGVSTIEGDSNVIMCLPQSESSIKRSDCEKKETENVKDQKELMPSPESCLSFISQDGPLSPTVLRQQKETISSSDSLSKETAAGILSTNQDVSSKENKQLRVATVIDLNSLNLLRKNQSKPFATPSTTTSNANTTQNPSTSCTSSLSLSPTVSSISTPSRTLIASTIPTIPIITCIPSSTTMLTPSTSLALTSTATPTNITTPTTTFTLATTTTPTTTCTAIPAPTTTICTSDAPTTPTSIPPITKDMDCNAKTLEDNAQNQPSVSSQPDPTPAVSSNPSTPSKSKSIKELPAFTLPLSSPVKSELLAPGRKQGTKYSQDDLELDQRCPGDSIEGLDYLKTKQSLIKEMAILRLKNRTLQETLKCLRDQLKKFKADGEKSSKLVDYYQSVILEITAATFKDGDKVEKNFEQSSTSSTEATGNSSAPVVLDGGGSSSPILIDDD